MANDPWDRLGLSGTWELQPDAAIPPPGGRVISLVFRGGSVAGMAGVNRYRGRVEVHPDRAATQPVSGHLRFGPLATTLMAGPPAAMAAEQAYLAALSRTDGFRVAGEALHLLVQGQPLLTFRRAPSALTC